MSRSYLLLSISLLTGSIAFAQQKVVADKIIAIVGDKPILKSDVANAVADAQRQNQGMALPPDVACRMVENMLATKALVFQAEKDSLPLSDEEVEADLDNRIRYYTNLYGGKEAFEQVAQKSVYQFKEEFRPAIREQKLAASMRNKIVDEVKVSPMEVKAYYDKIPKDSLPFFETEVQMGEIVVYPKASRDIEKLAIDDLNEYKQQAESGQKKFEALAQFYSDDKGTQQAGGTLPINRTEKNAIDPTFLAAAFRLKPGQISPVIKSKFGYHIILMVARNGDDAVVRHILKIPQVTDAELAGATQKLDSVRGQLLAGTISFGEAVNKYSDDDVAKYTGGMKQSANGSTFLTIDKLDSSIVRMLKDLKVGEYSRPVAFSDDQQRKRGVRIIYLKSKSDPHRENLKDDYNRIASQAADDKRNDVLEKWFATKIPSYYIMVDDDIKSCPQLDLWMKSASAAHH